MVSLSMEAKFFKAFLYFDLYFFDTKSVLQIKRY